MPLKPIILKGEQKRVLFLQVNEPIQIKGVAGSGKTTVALYRAKHLLDTQTNLFEEARVAIFTYNKTLVKYINAIIPYISGGYSSTNEEIRPSKPQGMNVVVTSFHKWAYRFIEKNGIELSKIIDNRRIFKTIRGYHLNEIILPIILKYRAHNITRKSVDFFLEEISWMKGKTFQNQEEYFDAKRTGRGTGDRVSRTDKQVIWNIFTDYNSQLKNNDQVDFDDYALLCLRILKENTGLQKPFTHIVIDEAQDLSKAQILVLSQLVSEETKSITLIADAAQRIYKSGFTWAEVGLNVRGRTIEFKKNYRNTSQIIDAAVSLLEHEDDKSDFTIVEAVRKGEDKPTIGYFQSCDEQYEYILQQLNILKQRNILDSTVILHRVHHGVNKMSNFLKSHNFKVQELTGSDDIDFNDESIKLCTMSSVKGLEFDNVFVVDLNDDIIPYPPGFNDDENDEFHESTERRLLYTSMTRAKDKLFLLSSGEPSRYLSEINPELVVEVRKNSVNKLILEDDDLPF